MLDASLRQGDAYAGLRVRQFRAAANYNFWHQLASSNTYLKPVLLPKTRLPGREAQSVFMRPKRNCSSWTS